MVTTESKKEFIKWFLDNYELRESTCDTVLNYIISTDNTLERIKFVRNARYFPNGIVMSTICTLEIPFGYYRVSSVITDVFSAFRDLRISEDETFYIQLNFKGNNNCSSYLSILEDDERNQAYTREMNDFMDKMLLKGKIDLLKKQIDKALDDRNEEEFYKLTSELNKLTV